MAGVNKVILVGRLGKEPEVRHLESGVGVANFSLATSETYKDRNSGERKEITDWHNIVLWRGLADVAEKYLHKGDLVYIEGRLKTRSWQDKDGNTRYTTEVVGDNMTMLGSKGSSQGNTPPPPTEEPAGKTTVQNTESTTTDTANDTLASTDAETDDLPF